MTVDVPVVAVGESALSTSWAACSSICTTAVMVRAKPDDLPSALEIDISGLDSFEAVLHVSDLHVPDGVTLVTDPSEPMLRVQQPRVEEEPVAAEAEEGVEEAAAETAEAGEATSADAGGSEEGSES